MKQLILILLSLFTLGTSYSQECTKFIEPKFITQEVNVASAYNEKDYEFVMIVAGKPPIKKTHYKKVIVKDGYTGIDYEKSKLLGRLCTKWYEPIYKEVVDWVEEIKPAIPPQMAWVKKGSCKAAAPLLVEKNIKDGHIAITTCE